MPLPGMCIAGMMGTEQGGGNTSSLTFLADYEETDASISNIDFGAADAGRRVFITIGWQGSAASEHTISSATIGGGVGNDPYPGEQPQFWRQHDLRGGHH